MNVLTFTLTMTPLLLNLAWAKSTETVLYSFNGGSNGANPKGPLLFENAKTLYGLAGGGGQGSGVIFRLTPEGGNWQESVLYTYPGDPAFPGSNVVFDSAGNLYATSQGAGECGGVLQFVPGSGGAWTLNALFEFTADQGCYPQTLTFDPVTGNLYGGTLQGGAFNLGTIFELSPLPGGNWQFNLIYTFGTNKSDGNVPLAFSPSMLPEISTGQRS